MLAECLQTKKYFIIVTTNTYFCLFICVFIFASNSGHFRIYDILLFLAPLFFKMIFLFNLCLFLQKKCVCGCVCVCVCEEGGGR